MNTYTNDTQMLIRRFETKVIRPLIREYGLPQYAKDGDAGMDLRACITEPITHLPAQGRILIPTGIAIHICDSNIGGFIYPRSGKAHKIGITVGNNVGVVDASYQDEIFVSVKNDNRYDLNAGDEYLGERNVIEPGERIAQIVFHYIVRAGLVEVEEFSGVHRGGGFGHTGRL